MLEAGKLVFDHELFPFSEVFRYCFPNGTYTSAKAKRWLLQLPLATITLDSCGNGKAEIYLLEALKGLDYAKLIEFIESKMSRDEQ